jgi:hypothetical protein
MMVLYSPGNRFNAAILDTKIDKWVEKRKYFLFIIIVKT